MAKPGPLAALVAYIAQEKPEAARMLSMPEPGAMPGREVPSDDPSMLQYFRRTWTRLSADQRLAQSESSLPENAGPLNSQHLVHRSLAQMRELSPAYFDRFIAHVDALLWIERAQEQAAKEARTTAGKKGGAGRKG